MAIATKKSAVASTEKKSSSRVVAPKAAKKVVKKAKSIKKPVVLTPLQKLEKVGIDAICARIGNCEFLSVIASDCDVSRSFLSKWLGSDVNQNLYACAREAQADKMAEDILSISDDGTRDTYIDKDGAERTDQDVIARSRLRVDSRKWLAAKMAPKKYGDKMAIEAEITQLTPEQVAARLAVLMAKHGT